MYEDDLDEEYLDDEVEIAVSRILMSRLFCGVPAKFTIVDFSHSFKRSFGKEANHRSVLSALEEALEMDLVSELEDGTYEFNGIFWWTEDLN